jgi:simple sugar transport system ATP-binding protein
MPATTPTEGFTKPLVSLRGIDKSFGEVHANQAIDLEIYASQVLALLGENGAGKSTLVKILYGFYQADSGTIEYQGEEVNIKSPREARALQIGMVFQTFNLIPAFTVAENIALFFPELKEVYDLKRVARRIDELSERYNLAVDPLALVRDLSIGDQQKVEILKLLISDARILILDEPTRVLAPHEIEALFVVIDNLRTNGYAIILITHKLHEVIQIADQVSVLRKGKVAGTLPIEQASEEALVELMFGQKVTEFQGIEAEQHISEAKPLLELIDVSTRAEGSEVSLQGIDLTICSGEIIGVTGVSGNGQRELADLILGRRKVSGGTVLMRGEDITGASIGTIRGRGVAFIPENPLQMAVAPFMTVLENYAVPYVRRYEQRAGLRIDWSTAREDYARSMETLAFDFPLYAPARSLSGGNLQRMVIAREMAHQPELIIASYLTSGLDVRSAIAARQALVQARDQGAGVLLFSDDLDELFAISDRLVVLQGGRLRGQFKPSETTFQEVGYLMTASGVEHDD